MVNARALLAQELAAGTDLESALALLRQLGATPVETIVAIREVRRVDLAEAKRVFSQSPAWKLENAAADRLHEELLHALNEPDNS